MLCSDSDPLLLAISAAILCKSQSDSFVRNVCLVYYFNIFGDGLWVSIVMKYYFLINLVMVL